MEKPKRVSGKGYSDLVRDEKVKVLQKVKPLAMDDVVLGQYVGNPNAANDEEKEGYLDDKTVPDGSVTPTYALAKFAIDNERWKGVPFLMKCGKALNERKAEIRIQFKQPDNVEDTFGGQEVPLNELVMRVQPNLAIYMKCNIKMPGLTSTPVMSELNMSYNTNFADVNVPDAYTRLILDVLRGQQAAFVRTDELKAAWEIFTPLLHEIDQSKIKPIDYVFGSRGPKEADEMISNSYVRPKSYKWGGHEYGSIVETEHI
jgi:glucose-6-phosphate 1-dehydrogenase